MYSILKFDHICPTLNIFFHNPWKPQGNTGTQCIFCIGMHRLVKKSKILIYDLGNEILRSVIACTAVKIVFCIHQSICVAKLIVFQSGDSV